MHVLETEHISPRSQSNPVITWTLGWPWRVGQVSGRTHICFYLCLSNVYCNILLSIYKPRSRCWNVKVLSQNILTLEVDLKLNKNIITTSLYHSPHILSCSCHRRLISPAHSNRERRPGYQQWLWFHWSLKGTSRVNVLCAAKTT